jgi:hypothetical protein
MGIRATYGSPTTGVRAAISRWRAHAGGRPLDDLTRLADVDPDDLAIVLANRQRLTGGLLKTAGIVEASTRLLDAGVRHAADLAADSVTHRAAYESVPGLGARSWQQLCLTLGRPGPDADWLVELVSTGVARRVQPAEALQLIEAAASSAGWDARGLLRHLCTDQRRSRA